MVDVVDPAYRCPRCGALDYGVGLDPDSRLGHRCREEGEEPEEEPRALLGVVTPEEAR